MSNKDFKEAQRRVEKAVVEKATELNLSFLDIDQLPDLSGLPWLKTLDCFYTEVSDLTPLRALTNLQELDFSYTRVNDLVSLKALTNLQTLNFSDTLIRDLAPLKALTNLQKLSCSSTEVRDLAPIKALTYLQTLNCSSTEVRDLAPIKALTNLQTLNCSSTEISDLAPIIALTNLQTLHFYHTLVSDLVPIIALTNLQTLDCSNTGVSDLAPLKALTNLETLDCGETHVSDLGPLKALANLQTLHCNETQVSDLAPLKALTKLETLQCRETQVNDLSPLKTLTNLQTLDCGLTQVSDLAPLKALTNLETLYCGDTQVSVLEPINFMPVLKELDIDSTEVSNLEPMRGRSLKIDFAALGPVEPSDFAFWEHLCSLEHLAEVDDDPIRHTYPKGIATELLDGLEKEERNATILRLLKEKEGENAEALTKFPDLKAVILGNGQVGKSSLRHAIVGQLGVEVDSTHGIDFGSLPLCHPENYDKDGTPDRAAGQLHLWDFGGQDFYHQTHRHFMENTRLFILAWNPEAENADQHFIDGEAYDNHPLSYWLNLIDQHAKEKVEVFIVQTKASENSAWTDEKVRELIPDAEIFEKRKIRLRFRHTSYLSHDSTQKLAGELRKTAVAIREGREDGLPKGFITALMSLQDEAKKTTEVYLDPEASNAEKEKHPPTWTYERFITFCKEQAQIDDGCTKLAEPHWQTVFLNMVTQTGLIIYDPDKLGQVTLVLARPWLLDPTYALFDRNGPYQTLKAQGGIFRHHDLLRLWKRQDYSERQQKAAIAFMKSNGLLISDWKHDAYFLNTNHTSYIVPDLLPKEPPLILCEEWAKLAGTANEEPILGEEALEAFMASALTTTNDHVQTKDHGREKFRRLRLLQIQLGELYGARCIFWRSGVAIKTGNSILRYMMTRTGNELALESSSVTSNEQIDADIAHIKLYLSFRLLKLIGSATRSIWEIEIALGQFLNTERSQNDGKPYDPIQVFENNRSEIIEKLSAHVPTIPIASLSPVPDVFISYNWGSDKPEDKRYHELLIDAIEQMLLQKGLTVLRDKRVTRPGASLRAFMHEATKDYAGVPKKKVIIILNDRYFKSQNCMFEFMRLWVNSGQDLETFRKHTYVFHDGAAYSTMEQRQEIATYWLRYARDVRKGQRPHLGEQEDLSLAPNDLEFLDLIDDVMPRLPEILELFADLVTPRKLEELIPLIKDWSTNSETSVKP